MRLNTHTYLDQSARWPKSGRHILAQYDADSVVVYQAYNQEIGQFAAKHGYFGGSYNLSRMSWIKPNFLWMMYRCGWASKPEQEVVLAVTLQRTAFDQILSAAVHSKFQPAVYLNEDIWKDAVASSEVRLQWDPDHHPSGAKLDRRAIQLGLRGSVLGRYAQEWIVGIEDISEFVREQARKVEGRQYNQLVTPREDVYPVTDTVVAQKLGISAPEGS